MFRIFDTAKSGVLLPALPRGAYVGLAVATILNRDLLVALTRFVLEKLFDGPIVGVSH